MKTTIPYTCDLFLRAVVIPTPLCCAVGDEPAAWCVRLTVINPCPDSTLFRHASGSSQGTPKRDELTLISVTFTRFAGPVDRW
jgi:hypothetical protein